MVGPAVLDRRRILVILGGLTLAQIMAGVEGTIVATAQRAIGADLGGLRQISWIFTGYLLGQAASTPLWGKLGDLLGRKRLYQLAIAVFIGGAIVSGTSVSMSMLIVGRTIQGIGAGGLFSLSMAIMGDLLSPRERGRYIGYMGGAFAGATILGPLIGGLFVDYATWRWIFLFMLPLGFTGSLIANLIPALPIARREHRIDYLGAALLVAWVTAVVFVTRFGGEEWAWGSWQIVTLGVAGGAALLAFIAQQRRAVEPILPPRLFRERIVVTASFIQFFVGFVMIGVTIMSPLYLQFVKNVTATRSGLLTIPITLGMLTTSVGTGRRISATGRYRQFPIIGALVMTISLVLLSSMNTGTSRLVASAYMFTFGLGIGATMQTVLVAVQNRVPHDDLGIATSATSFFRTVGQTIGSAVFSAVLIMQLDHELPRLVPGQAIDVDSLQGDPAKLAALSPEVRAGIAQSFAHALHDVFLVAVPIGLIAFVITWLVPEHPLRERRASEELALGAVEAVA
jgi:EmrB/QacA subfamily drug resistance transporter